MEIDDSPRRLMVEEFLPFPEQVERLIRVAELCHDRGQRARLAAVFPNGVCDWTRPGVGQTDAVLTTFENGPGGVPLGPAPVSSVFP